MQFIQAADYAAVRYLNAFVGRSLSFDQFVYDVSASYVLQGGIYMAIFWWLWFRQRDQFIARRAVIIAMIGGLAAVILSQAVQHTFPYHERPLHTPDLGFVRPAPVNPATLLDWTSFPSDHAVLYFAFATGIWFQAPAFGWIAGVWGLIIGCLPRIYLGYHYPSDVIAGALFGILIMAAAERTLRHSRFPDRLLRLEESRRTAFYCLAFLGTFELALMFYDARQLARDGAAIVASIGHRQPVATGTVTVDTPLAALPAADRQ